MLNKNQLREISIFKDIEDHILEKLISICKLRVINKDECLFKYNEKINSLFMILKGEIELRLPLSQGGEITLHKAKQGEVIGLSSILPQECLTLFSAICSQDSTELIELNTKELLIFFEKDKEMAYTVLLKILKAYNLKKVRQNFLLINSLLNHKEIKKILGS